jgi:hypothetical protein
MSPRTASPLQRRIYRSRRKQALLQGAMTGPAQGPGEHMIGNDRKHKCLREDSSDIDVSSVRSVSLTLSGYFASLWVCHDLYHLSMQTVTQTYVRSQQTYSVQDGASFSASETSGRGVAQQSGCLAPHSPCS